MKEDRVIGRILELVRRDGNIRAAVLNGSRANPNAPADFMRDYDVALYARDMDRAEIYRCDGEWMAGFGRLVIMQQNGFDGGFIRLMQFDDGLRIDLSFHPLERLRDNINEDSLSVLLYDADNIVGSLPAPDDSTYFVRKPNRGEWDATLNELWWLQPYIAKELWRDELPLVKELYDEWLMVELRKLVSWHIAASHDWRVNVGHGGKWFKFFLDEETYSGFVRLYSGAEPGEQWEKLLSAGAFIRGIGEPLALRLGYEYPVGYDANVSAYIRRIHDLPATAESL